MVESFDWVLPFTAHLTSPHTFKYTDSSLGSANDIIQALLQLDSMKASKLKRGHTLSYNGAHE